MHVMQTVLQYYRFHFHLHKKITNALLCDYYSQNPIARGVFDNTLFITKK